MSLPIAITSIITGILALIIAQLATRRTMAIAKTRKIGSLPNDRKIHVGFIPSMGGIGIFAGISSGILLSLIWYDTFWQGISLHYAGIAIGAMLMLFTGILDDLRGLSAQQKFMAQILAAAIVILF